MNTALMQFVLMPHLLLASHQLPPPREKDLFLEHPLLTSTLHPHGPTVRSDRSPSAGRRRRLSSKTNAAAGAEVSTSLLETLAEEPLLPKCVLR